MGSMVFPLKNNESVATLWTKKEEKQKARIDFEGLRYVKEDGGLCVGTWAINCNAYNKQDQVKFPGILEFRLDYNDKGDKALGMFIEELDPEKSYSGYVEIDADSKLGAKTCKAIETGNNDLLEAFKDSFIAVTEAPQVEALAAWKPSEKKSGGRGSNSKSKLEIAKERWTAIKFMTTDETMSTEIEEFLTVTYEKPPTATQKLDFLKTLVN